MGTKISSQTTALTGQAAAEALPNSDVQDKPTANQPSDKTKPLGASYELTLSETAQSLMGSNTPTVNNSADAQKKLDLIKAAAQQSPATVLSLQKPDMKSVLDLLA